MARTPLFSRLRRSEAPRRRIENPASARGQRPRRALTPGQLRRERRALIHAREERIRDLGGLMLEMYKQDRFNHELVADYCAELVDIDGRIEEIDALLVAALSARRTAIAEGRCACGAPILVGSHFCANCGRPVGETPVVACRHCGSPLPADVQFCGNCGSPAEVAEPAAQPAAAIPEQPSVPPAGEPEPPPPEPVAQAEPSEERAPAPPAADDRWEQ